MEWLYRFFFFGALRILMFKSKVQNGVGHENNGNIKFSFLLKVPLIDFALSVGSKKISNDQELIQSDPISCPQNQKGNN